jgi:hypothetical protein
MVPASYAPVMAAGITATILVVVAVLGSWLNRKNEHAKWLREQRIQAYSEWLGLFEEQTIVTEDTRDNILAYDKILEHIIEWNTAQGDETTPYPHLEKERGEAYKLLQQLKEDHRKVQSAQAGAFNKVQIVATKPVREQAEVLNHIGGLLPPRDGSPYEDWNIALARFHEVVRKELGLEK